MKKALLAGLVLVPLAGCAHQQGGYAGGASGYFYGDCLDDYGYGYGCDYGPYHRYYYTYDNLGAVGPAVPQRANITKVQRRVSPRVVERAKASPAPPAGAGNMSRAAPARSAPTAAFSRSAPAASMPRSAPAAASSSQTVSRR